MILRENNRLITEFMKTVFHDDEDEDYDDDGLHIELELQYLKSWVLLMKVVDKIELTNEVIISKNQCTIMSNNNVLIKTKECVKGLTKREATYYAIVEYIKYYNENK